MMTLWSSCSEKIEKGVLRIAIENEVDTGMFVRKGAGYLHGACAVEQTGEEPVELFAKIKANSMNLNAQDLSALEDEMVS